MVWLYIGTKRELESQVDPCHFRFNAPLILGQQQQVSVQYTNYLQGAYREDPVQTNGFDQLVMNIMKIWFLILIAPSSGPEKFKDSHTSLSANSFPLLMSVLLCISSLFPTLLWYLQTTLNNNTSLFKDTF